MSIYERLLELNGSKGAAQIVTLIAGPETDNSAIGRTFVVYGDGSVDSDLADDSLCVQVLDYLQRVKWDKPGIFQFSRDSEYVFFRDRYAKRRTAVVFGGGHISKPLVAMLAMLDFTVTVIDDRPEFANKARFPEATQVICNEFSSVLKNGELEIDGDTAVVIVTRGHRHDLDCLRETIHLNACYLGMIGSRRRIKGIMDMLLDEGTSRENLEKLQAPIGIDVGAVTPAEIALSIAAQIIAVFNSGSLDVLSLQNGGVQHG